MVAETIKSTKAGTRTQKLKLFILGKAMSGAPIIIGTNQGLLTVMFLWWRDVIKESTFQQAHTPVVELGLYRGQCSEICGTGHGYMPVILSFKTKTPPA